MYRTPDDSSPRNVVVHVPSDLDPNEAVPILFAMHGATMSGEIMHEVADFDAIADRERFVVVYPSGTPGFAPWNVNTAGAQGGVCGTGALVSGDGNDVAFVEQMLADIADEQCIDREAVFVTGFSMGGYFSNHIGCQTGDYLVRAIAPHSGGTYATVDCPGGHVPALILHGTNDGVIGANCGDDAASKWVQRNGCGSTFTTTPIEGGECRRYDGCPADGQVVHCVYEGMAHGWAGSPTGDQPGAETVGFYSGGTQYESASELIWSFFEEQLP